MARGALQRAIEGGKRKRGAAKIEQRIAAIIERAGMIRRQRQRRVEVA